MGVQFGAISRKSSRARSASIINLPSPGRGSKSFSKGQFKQYGKPRPVNDSFTCFIIQSFCMVIFVALTTSLFERIQAALHQIFFGPNLQAI